MKVLHVSPTHYAADSVIGGGERYVLYHAAALSSAADYVKNVVLAFGDKATETVVNDLQCVVATGRPWDPYSINVDELLRRIKDADVVIVHQCLSAFGLFIASHARLAGKYVVGMDHGGGEHALVSHTTESCLMFHLFLAQSDFAARAFHGLNVPIRIILGPVDTRYYGPPVAGEREKNLVLAVGRILPHKGFDRIIRVLPKNMRLIIAGTVSDKAYHDMLMELIHSSGGDVRIIDGLPDEDIRELLRNASLFVHASTHIDYKGTYYAKPELLGLAPLEALACGTPALVSSAGSLPELGAVVGCNVFHSNDELKELLDRFAEYPVFPTASEIYESVKSLYGIEQYGQKLLTELTATRAAA